MHLHSLHVWKLTPIFHLLWFLLLLPCLFPCFATFNQAFISFFAPFNYLEVIPFGVWPYMSQLEGLTSKLKNASLIPQDNTVILACFTSDPPLLHFHPFFLVQYFSSFLCLKFPPTMISFSFYTIFYSLNNIFANVILCHCFSNPTPFLLDLMFSSLTSVFIKVHSLLYALLKFKKL